MDFIVRLPRAQKQYDSICMVVDTLTKSAHFVPIKSTYLKKDYSRILIEEIVCRHGILLSIRWDMGA